MTQAKDPMRSREPWGRAHGGNSPVIVIGLDGSPTSWDAFSWAAGEAARLGGRLIAVYVTPAMEPGAALGVPFDYAAAQQARQELTSQLRDDAERRAHDIGVPISFVRELGDIADALTSVAQSVDAQLLVVGRSAKLLHHVAGSLSRRIIARPDAPVVVVVP